MHGFESKSTKRVGTESWKISFHITSVIILVTEPDAMLKDLKTTLVSFLSSALVKVAHTFQCGSWNSNLQWYLNRHKPKRKQTGIAPRPRPQSLASAFSSWIRIYIFCLVIWGHSLLWSVPRIRSIGSSNSKYRVLDIKL